MPDFDPVAAVAEYRQLIEQLERETTPIGRHELEGIAKRMRQRWHGWQGEDSLHEMAFGEPGE